MRFITQKKTFISYPYFQAKNLPDLILVTENPTHTPIAYSHNNSNQGASIVVASYHEAIHLGPGESQGRPSFPGNVPPAVDPITATALEAVEVLYGQYGEGGYDGQGLEHEAIGQLAIIDLRLISYQHEVTNLKITPAQVFTENYFAEFDTEEYPDRSYDYKIALFRFAYDYFRADDEMRAQMKYKIQLAHHAAMKAHEAAEQRALTELPRKIGETAVNPE